MGKTRDLYQKIRELERKFQAKIGMIQDRNGKDLSEAEDVKERWAEDLQERTNWEPDILESEMADNKTSGHDEIPAELFNVTGKDAVKVLRSICQKIWIMLQWPEDSKRSVCIPIPKKRSSKGCADYQTIALISHARKVMLKILQNRLRQYLDREQPEEQARLGKEEELEIKFANIRWIMEKAREFQCDVYLCFIEYAKAFDSIDHN
ncbi:uncharacterized protein LOC124717072, partial [Schistocerca piceifrons]|uniref:uncharacterized protein LOC124717072 n=1 Tax=Schistocerca piceifrons TaxID=274613 RepID=UPI001F5EB077